MELVTDAAGADLYPVAFAIDTAFGRAVGVDLSAALDADPATLIALLHAGERPLAYGMRGARLVEFAGGRIASRLARSGMPGAERPTLRGPSGRPTATGGISISHTRSFAVALATPEAGCSIGVDIEALDEGDAIPLLAERILSDRERMADHKLRPIPLLRRFSLKEAAYKALFPRFGHIPLRDISVVRSSGPGGGYRIVVPPPAHGPIAAASSDLHGHVLSFVRVD